MKKIKAAVLFSILFLSVLTVTQINSVFASDANWDQLADRPYGLIYSGLEYYDGCIYSVTGRDNNNNRYNNTYQYFMANESWLQITDLPYKKDAGGTGILTYGGHTYLHYVGGFPGTTPEHWAYNFSSGTWITKSNPPVNNVWDCGGLAYDGYLWIIGGSNDGTAYNTTYCYFPENDTWDTKAEMNYGHAKVAVSAYNGKIYAFTSNWAVNHYHVEVYDIATDSWNTLNDAPIRTPKATKTAINGKIYLDDHWNKTLLEYDPETDTYTNLLESEYTHTQSNQLTLLPVNNTIYKFLNLATSPESKPFYAYELSYQLSFSSVPIGVSFTLNGSSLTTPYTTMRKSGLYEINFTESFSRGGLTWNFAYWSDDTSNTNPDRTITLTSNSSYSVVYTSEYEPIEYTGYDPVFECAMNNMFELNGILEGNDTYRQMLLDSSPYENHGKMYPLTHPYAGPSLTWGRMGKALEFDGVDDSVIVANSDSLNITEAITIEFWFMTYNATPNQKFLSKTNGTDQEWVLGLNNSRLYVELWTANSTGSGPTGTQYQDYTNSETIEAGIFYFLALTYDYRDGYFTVFLHGVPAFNVTTDGLKIRNIAGGLYLGSLSNSSFWFNGVLDEVRIFPYKRDYNEVYTDARTPISRFDRWSFVNSGTSNDGSTWNVVEGVTSGYQGFTHNDPELPWAFANVTHPHTFVRTLRYIAGLQSYQLYCNLTFTTNVTSGSMNPIGNYVLWYWNFFRNGRLQVTYDLKIQIQTLGGGAPLHISRIYIYFRRTTPYLSTEEMYSGYVDTTYTLFPNSLPLIVSAWVGPDDKHFTMRVNEQDNRLDSSSVGWKLPISYSFDLIDENGNSHNVNWFDGWIVEGIKVRARRDWNPTGWSRMEISSHKFFDIIGALKKVISIPGKIVSYLFFPSVKEAVNTVVEVVDVLLSPITEIVGTAVKIVGDTVADALAGLAHDLIGGFAGLASSFLSGLSPIQDLLTGLGSLFVNALISMMQPLVTELVAVSQRITASLIGFIDVTFGLFGVEDLLAMIMIFIVQAWAYASQALGWFIDTISPIFAFLAVVMAKFLNTMSSIFAGWTLVIQGIFSALGDGFGTGIHIWNDLNLATWVTLIAILYPVYLFILWEEKGIDAVISQIKFIMDVLAWLMRILVQATQAFIAVIDMIVEKIPILE